MKKGFQSSIGMTISLMAILFSAICSFAQTIPRPEYPRPQFERTEWKNLNGPWSYTFDFDKTGLGKGFIASTGFKDQIMVPFCPESKLSGIEYKDFIEEMWYQRKLEVPKTWSGKKIMIHFGGVDYQSELYIDGKKAGSHWGGTSSFSHDISDYITPGGNNNLVLRVIDNRRLGKQPGGKQSLDLKSSGCDYSRTTGIWRTVWLEAVAKNGLKDCHVTADLDNARFIIQPQFYTLEQGMKFKVKILDGEKVVAKKEIFAGNNCSADLKIKKPKTWSPESPFLYSIIYQVTDRNNVIIDEVKSYAGMRKIHIEGNRIFLNNKPLYLRFVLDQGFYPEGIWTAPTDEALKNDVQLSMNAGFNGARLHQKIFDERFHYWADKLGYLTWAESSSGGFGVNDPEGGRNFLSEWFEIVTRDRNHPSIIAWTPFNETGSSKNPQFGRLVNDICNVTKNLDPTRPINDASGWTHIRTDLWTAHCYVQNPEEFKNWLTPNEKRQIFTNYAVEKYNNQPYILDEYGGIKWVSKSMSESSWGYSQPNSIEEYYDQLGKLTDAILTTSYITGYCYTQFTDVEQEQNGIYNLDRSLKFDMKKIKAIFSKVPPEFEINSKH
jgi:beta-galactosidase/beta-glucuronidase